MEQKIRVLMIDDDEFIRFTFKELLTSFGYDVVTCEDGHCGIREYQSALDENKSFQVIIIDLTIPDGLGGEKTMERILQIDPAAVGILASGFPDLQSMRTLQTSGFSAIIEKPYRVDQLHKTIQQVLSVKKVQ